MSVIIINLWASEAVTRFTPGVNAGALSLY